MPILSQTELQMLTGALSVDEYHWRKKAQALKKLEDWQRTKINHEYVARRDALIPAAESYTRRVLELHHGNPNYQFNRLFLAEMDRLAREAGI